MKANKNDAPIVGVLIDASFRELDERAPKESRDENAREVAKLMMSFGVSIDATLDAPEPVKPPTPPHAPRPSVWTQFADRKDANPKSPRASAPTRGAFESREPFDPQRAKRGRAAAFDALRRADEIFEKLLVESRTQRVKERGAFKSLTRLNDAAFISTYSIDGLKARRRREFAERALMNLPPGWSRSPWLNLKLFGEIPPGAANTSDFDALLSALGYDPDRADAPPADFAAFFQIVSRCARRDG